MTVIARGLSAAAEAWELEVDGDARDFSTTLTVTLPDGARLWGIGTHGPATPGDRVQTTWGRNDVGPGQLLLRLAPDVRAVVVTLSDGTREDLVLHGDPAVLGARIAVLVYPRELDVHRIDVHDPDGTISAAGTP